MERYHIFKLGLAILFYAAYCVRPTLVDGSKVDDIAHSRKRSESGRQILGESLVFYQGVDGTPGIDFPILSYIPKTAFTCKNIETGYYADLDTDCQVFHICEDGRKISFLCPNGTIFQQSDLICEWWYKVDCSNSPNLYEESAEQLKEDVARRKANRRINADAQMTNYGAIMRTEEISSVSVKHNGKPYEVRLRKDKKLISSGANKVGDQSSKVTSAHSHINRFSDSVPKSAIELANKHSNQQQTEEKPKRYNDQHTSNFLNNQDKGSAKEPTGQNLKEYHLQFSATSPGLDAAASIENVYVSSTSPSLTNVSPSQISVNRNVITNRGSVKYFPSNTDENTNADKYNLEFPKHKSQISNERGKATSKIDSADSKPKSSVPLTKNDIVNRRLEPNESDELQITQETAGFVTNSYNSIQSGSGKFSTTNPHPNHRTTYSDLKQPKFSSTKVSNTISSVTPQYITTQSINSGKPFIGSTVGVRIFGGDFRKGANTLPSASSTQSPVETGTKRVLDHATVYGTFSRSTTPRPSTSSDGVQVKFSKNTDKIGVQLSKSIGGSPTVEVGTNKFGQTSLEINRNTLRPEFDQSTSTGRFVNTETPEVKFSKNADKIGVQLSKSLGGSPTVEIGTNKFGQTSLEINGNTPRPEFDQSTSTGRFVNIETPEVKFSQSSSSVDVSGRFKSTDSPPVSTTDAGYGTTLGQTISGQKSIFDGSATPISTATIKFEQSSFESSTLSPTVGQSTLKPTPFELSTTYGSTDVPPSTTDSSTAEIFGQSTLKPTPFGITSTDIPPTSTTDKFGQTGHTVIPNLLSLTTLRPKPFDVGDSFGQTAKPVVTNEGSYGQSATTFDTSTKFAVGFEQTSRPATSNSESFDQSTLRSSLPDVGATYGSKNVASEGTTDGTDTFGQTSRPAIANAESFDQSTLRSSLSDVGATYGSKNIVSGGTTDGTDTFGQTSRPVTANAESFGQSTLRSSLSDIGATYRSKNIASEGTTDGTDTFGQTSKPAVTDTNSVEQRTRGPELLDIEVRFGGGNVPRTTGSYGSTSFGQTATNTDSFGQSTVRPTPFEFTTKYESTEVPRFSTVGTVTEEIATKTSESNTDIIERQRNLEGTTKSPFADSTTRSPFLFSASTEIPQGRSSIPKYGSAVVPPLLSSNSFLRVSDFPSSTGPKGGLILTGIGSNTTFTSVESSYAPTVVSNTGNLIQDKSAATFRPSANEGTTSTAATYLPTVKVAESSTAKPASRFKSPTVDTDESQSGGTSVEKSREYDDVLVPPLPSLKDLKSGTASPKDSGFFVTKGGRESPTTETYLQSTPQVDVNLVGGTANPKEAPPSGFALSKSETQWPRPFQKSLNSIDSAPKGETVTPTYFSYQISSARPFELPVKATPTPTLPTPFTTAPTEGSIKENIDNMIDVLTEIVNNKNEDFSAETPRPGLVVPPSAGPQTLHTLAQYFANALDGIAAEREKETGEELDDERKEKLTSLLTQMTMYRYNELFKSNDAPSPTESAEEILEGEHTESFKETPALKQLARNFSVALSSYLNDPQAFRKDLESLRPTEPPPLTDDNTEVSFDEELLNFSDTDNKSSFPPVFPTLPSVSPTWGFILAKGHDDDVKNSLNPDLHTADSQSFVPAFNNLAASSGKKQSDEKANHWTTSPGVTKLWQSTLSVNPAAVNEQIGTTELAPESGDFETTPSFELPQREIQYELRALPKLTLNSTQVHGILIDFMNTTKSDETNRLQRILKKLNTTEDEFLDKMKEIESNPLTKRLILLLISECGADVTKDIAAESTSNLSRQIERSPAGESVHKRVANSDIPQLVDGSLREDDQDTRALQLLNSLYTIASRFGK